MAITDWALIKKHRGFFVWIATKGLLFCRNVLQIRTTKVRLGGKTFKLDFFFALSGFNSWGESAHNVGYRMLLAESSGKDVVFDVGAHIGLCTLPLALRAKKVYSFEPSTINFQYLNRHIRYNKLRNVSSFAYLVGESDEPQVPFYESRDRVSGMSSVTNVYNQDIFTETTRRQIALDTFCSAKNIIPSLIKIDVEGAEFGVLRGAEKLIKKHKPIIVLSVHPAHLKALGESASDLFTYCKKLGYKIIDERKKAVTSFKESEYLLIKK
ncbi:MAG: FkbM family methyltransferase [Candidatus Woesearchaeota archaeon]|jgi:FkbM family methyltransferase